MLSSYIWYCIFSQQTENKGHDILHCGLLQLSDKVLVKAIQAKHAFQDCVVQRVILTKAEIESPEHHRDLSEVHAENQDALTTTESHLELLMQFFDQHDLQDIKDDVAYYHAVFADAQVEQMNEVMDEEGSSLGRGSNMTVQLMRNLSLDYFPQVMMYLIGNESSY